MATCASPTPIDNVKDLKATRDRRRLQELIDQGEHEQQDFKYLISDARKIARSLSAFSNNSGGRLLIGVKDNGTVAGVRSEEDIFMIEQAGDLYCHPRVEIDFQAVKAAGGAVVFIASVTPAPSRPVMVKEEKNRMVAYYRVNDQNLVAPDLMVEAWRQASSDTGTLLSLTEAEHLILKLIADYPGETDYEDLATRAHVSLHASRQAVVRLLAVGLAEYRHNGHRFTLHPL